MDHDDVRRLARPLRGADDLDPLVERCRDARFVLIGEASHGTHEYYAWRALLTQRLLTEGGFSFVAVEGDWPDCAAVDRSVRRSPSAPHDPRKVLAGFARWPTWMWANEEVAAFARWLRQHNAGRPAPPVGFHGLDVYSLWDSLRVVLGYLREHEPEHLPAAQQAWRCFEPYREDPQEYARATRIVPTSCENQVVELLRDLCERALVPDEEDPEARFDAEQNAAVAAGAERYYRAMVRGGAESWNVRDVHMTDTLDRLMHRYGPDAKAVVWEHNTHVGDARATDMAADGMVNVGQLVRERHGAQNVVLVGFSGYGGSVIAGDAWGAPWQRMTLPDARPDSLEGLLSEAVGRGALFVFDDDRPAWLREWLDHRAIGVVYHPERERWGNYVPTRVGERYDALLFLQDTRALTPLEPEPAQPEAEWEAFPSGR